MPFQIEQKLVINVASSALFDLSESHQVYLDKGADEYRLYQKQHLTCALRRAAPYRWCTCRSASPTGPSRVSGGLSRLCGVAYHTA